MAVEQRIWASLPEWLTGAQRRWHWQWIRRQWAAEPELMHAHCHQLEWAFQLGSAQLLARYNCNGHDCLTLAGPSADDLQGPQAGALVHTWYLSAGPHTGFANFVWHAAGCLFPVAVLACQSPHPPHCTPVVGPCLGSCMTPVAKRYRCMSRGYERP